jgi:hypothetical protein
MINAHPTGDTIPKSPSRNLAASDGHSQNSISRFQDMDTICRPLRSSMITSVFADNQ